MSRRILVWLLVTLTLTTASYTHAQHTIKVFKIGFLASASEERVSGRLAAFKQGLQELGHVEGKNITIVQRSAAGQFDKLPDLAAEFCGSGSTSWWRRAPLRPTPPRTRRELFQSCSGMPPIRWAPGWWQASPSQAVISPDYRNSVAT